MYCCFICSCLAAYNLLKLILSISKVFLLSTCYYFAYYVITLSILLLLVFFFSCCWFFIIIIYFTCLLNVSSKFYCGYFKLFMLSYLIIIIVLLFVTIFFIYILFCFIIGKFIYLCLETSWLANEKKSLRRF